MKKVTISDLFVYPIKSSKGIQINSTAVLKSGFEFDRNLGILDSNNEMLTARENPKLLQIIANINNETMTLSNTQKDDLIIDLIKTNESSSKITLFKKDTFGVFINNEADQWISDVLKQSCRLVKIDTNNLRTVNVKCVNTAINYNDCFPIHLVTKASIDDLNSKLETPINDNRYRPNIILSGTNPYEEENWKSITIGNCEFDIITPSERCSLITINPVTLEKSKKQEPLRTLAKNRRGNKKVNFGIYLIPSNIGRIHKTNTVTITL